MYHCSSSSGFPHWICVSFRGTAFGNFLLKLRCCLLMQSSSRLLQQRPVPPYPAQKEQSWVWGPALATCITETSGCVACRLSSTGFRCFHIAAGLLCLDGDIVLKQVGSWFPPRHKTPLYGVKPAGEKIQSVGLDFRTILACKVNQALISRHTLPQLMAVGILLPNVDRMPL